MHVSNRNPEVSMVTITRWGILLELRNPQVPHETCQLTVN